MMEVTDRDKLRMLIPHWIEHNSEHASEFHTWAGKVDEARGKILEAAAQLESVSRTLQLALDQLGGPLDVIHHRYSEHDNHP
jgi:hypothetical protein